jgi:capsular exopolysaccharide synthesis family protein
MIYARRVSMLRVKLQNRVEMGPFVNEAYKYLRTNIMFCGIGVKALCVTSCVPNEGKSDVSFNLAVSLAESGKKVVFIDADLRKSDIIRRYNPDLAVFGLSHYLSAQNKIEDILYETNMDNLDIVFSGPVPPNPSELLGSDSFSDLVEIFRKVYDYIIVDTPPVGSVIDSAVVAQKCDGVILVIESDAISYKLAQKVVKQIEKSGSRILGAVLNKYEHDKRLYGYKYISYGKYMD